MELGIVVTTSVVLGLEGLEILVVTCEIGFGVDGSVKSVGVCMGESVLGLTKVLSSVMVLVCVVTNVVVGLLSDVDGPMVTIMDGLTVVGLDVDDIKVGTKVVVGTMVDDDGAGVDDDVNLDGTNVVVGANVVDDIKVGTSVVVKLTVVVEVAIVVDDIKVGIKVVVGKVEVIGVIVVVGFGIVVAAGLVVGFSVVVESEGNNVGVVGLTGL